MTCFRHGDYGATNFAVEEVAHGQITRGMVGRPFGCGRVLAALRQGETGVRAFLSGGHVRVVVANNGATSSTHPIPRDSIVPPPEME